MDPGVQKGRGERIKISQTEIRVDRIGLTWKGGVETAHSHGIFSGKRRAIIGHFICASA